MPVEVDLNRKFFALLLFCIFGNPHEVCWSKNIQIVIIYIICFQFVISIRNIMKYLISRGNRCYELFANSNWYIEPNNRSL